MVNYYLTKGTWVYNGVKIASSRNGVGRFGQLHAKKLNSVTNLHLTQKENQGG